MRNNQKFCDAMRGDRGAGFVGNWVVGGGSSRSMRRRVMAILRLSCAVLGINRRNLGLGSLAPRGGGPRPVSGFSTSSLETAGGIGEAALMAARAPMAHARGPASLVAGLFVLSLGVTAQPAAAGPGIYVNDGTDSGCIVTNDGTAAGSYTVSSTDPAATIYNANSGVVKCQPTDKSTQVDRVLFYGPDSSSGTTSVSIGGTAYVNSGNLGIGGGQTGSSANSIRIGGDPTLSETASGVNSIAIGASPLLLTSATGGNSMAVGTSARATQNNAIAIGSFSKALGVGAVAIGEEAQVAVEGGVALGNNSVANVVGGISGYRPVAVSGADGAAVEATKGSATWGAVSVGAGGGGNRQIVNLAAGTADSDAVNVAQLKAALTHDYSVKSITPGTDTNYDNTGAKGNNALAAGVSASTSTFATNGVAIGTSSKSLAAGGIAIGEYAEATGHDSVYVGGGAGQGSAYDGARGNANMRNVGFGALAGSAVTGQNNSAVGASTGRTVTGNANVSMGAHAGSTVTGDFNVAIGGVSSTCTDNGDPGGGSSGGGGGQSGGGGGDPGGLMSDCAPATLATGNNVTGNANMAIGNSAGIGVRGDRNIALGALAGGGVVANDTVSLGTGAMASANNAVAIGGGVVDPVSGALVTPGASATLADSVALGSGSVAAIDKNIAGYVPVSASLAQAQAIADTKGTMAAVSVGDASNGTFRQITSVAAGTADSDAVNVAQLKAVNTIASAGWDLTTGATGSGVASGTSVETIAPGERVTQQAGNNLIVSQTGNTVNYALNPVVTGLTSVSITGGPTISNTGINMANTSITNLKAGVDLGDAVNVSQLTLGLASVNLKFTGNAGGVVTRANGQTLAINGVGSTAGTYTGANLKTVTDPANGAINIQMTDAPVFTSVKTGNTTISNSGLTIVGGPSVTNTGINMANTSITNLKAGVDPTDAVNVSQLTAVVGTAALNFTGNAGGVVNRTNGQTLAINGVGSTAGTYTGANLKTVTDPANGAINIQMTDAPVFTSVKTGNTTISNSGLTIVGGPSVTNVGINAGNTVITNVAPGVNGTDAVNVSQLTTVNNVANRGWDLTTGSTGSGVSSGSSVEAIGPGERVTQQAGNNLIVTQAGNTVNYALNPVVTGLTSVSITGGPTISNTGINMANTSITNLKAGVDPTDAVNVSQLTAVIGTAALNFTGNSGGVVNRTNGQTLAINGVGSTAGTYTGANLKTVTDPANGAINIQMTDAPVFTSVKTGNTTINNSGLTIVGGPSVTNTGINMANTSITNLKAGVDPTDAVNVSQLTAVVGTAALNFTGNAGGVVNRTNGQTLAINGVGSTAGTYTGANLKTVTDPANGAINIQMTDAPEFTSVKTGNTTINNAGLTIVGGPSVTNVGINAGNTVITNVAPGVNGTDAVNVSQLTTVNNVANRGWDLTTGATGSGVALGSSLETVAPGERVTYQAGNNMIVSQTGNTVNYALNPIVTGLTSVSITGGPVIDARGIHNLAAGVDPTDAVNVSQLNSAIGNVAISFSGNSGGIVTRNNGQTLAIQGGATTAGTYSGGNVKTVTDPATGAVNIQIADAPKFGTVTINDGGTGKITGVTAGTISATSHDAVNGSQLFALGDSIANSLGGDSVYNSTTGTVTTSLAVGGNTYTTVQDALQAVNATANAGFNVTTAAVGTGTATGTSVQNIAPGATATFTAGNNIAITQKGAEVQVAVNPNLKVESVTINDGPVINNTGISLAAGDTLNMGGNTITNLRAGVNGTDGVNVSQLNAGLDNVLNTANGYTDSRFNALSFDLSKFRRDANAGTAAAMAMAAVPQAFEPGMGIVGGGVSTWMGQQAIAVGFSKASDNGRVIIKATGTVNSRGKGGAAAGVGFQF